MSIRPFRDIKRKKTKKIKVGKVEIGGDAPISVQSMTNTLTTDVYKTIPKARKKYLKAKIVYQGPIQAPIEKNSKLGSLIVTYKDEIIGEYDLFASEEVKKLNIFSRLIQSINYLIWGDV